MEYATFVRKPFTVEAVKITPENMDEIAELVGQVRRKVDGTPYILVDRRLVPGVFKVYAGYYMTRMNDNIRCYTPEIFEEQFGLQTTQAKDLVESLEKELSGSG